MQEQDVSLISILKHYPKLTEVKRKSCAERILLDIPVRGLSPSTMSLRNMLLRTSPPVENIYLSKVNSAKLSVMQHDTRNVPITYLETLSELLNSQQLIYSNDIFEISKLVVDRLYLLVRQHKL